MQPLAETFERITYAQQPPPEEDVVRIVDEGWPRFMLFDPLADKYWTRMHAYFPQFQFALYDDSRKVIAVCNSIPVVWDGNPDTLPPEGWDWAMDSGITGYEAGATPNTLCAISITIARSHIGQGISPYAVEGLRQAARENGLGYLIAPVRPSLKSMYPLTPMERYMCWKTDEGSPFDPWLRVHWRAGAKIVKPCPQSMVITGSVDQWEEWASMMFPESGTYIVPKALTPVNINVEDDIGRYVEPNVWMVHSL
ncbi:MAG: GNAT family N-acetyltransferase [Chloroflexi bacterium]|nr:GNAT family N-acetyltransferase [Chloroflexota bacterium]